MVTHTNITATLLAGLAALPAPVGGASKPTAEGAGIAPLLQDITLFEPEDGDPAFKKTSNERYGTQWAVDAAYAFWGVHNALPGTRHKNNYALLHAQVNQRLADSRSGGTWLRAEWSGSWALDHATRAAERRGQDFVSGLGLGTEGHADMYGEAGFFIPELALMHFFAGGRACVLGGMVNLSNYFDAVGIANDSFAGCTNTGFVNSTLLPLADSNLGGVLMWQFGSSGYAQLAAAGTGCERGHDPFRHAGYTHSGGGYCVVGEYGHVFAEGAATLRFTPFYEQVALETDAGTRHRSRTGFAASLEYTPCEPLTVYARAGLATHQALGGTAEFSCGARWAPFAARAGDFIGLSYGLFRHRKADESGEPPAHAREQVLELMYNWQLTRHLKVVPHYQYIHDPAYRRDTRHASVFGVQTVLSF